MVTRDPDYEKSYKPMTLPSIKPSKAYTNITSHMR